MWQKAIKLVDAKPELLSDEGQIIVQINPIEWEELSYENFEIFDERKYGDTLLVFFEKKDWHKFTPHDRISPNFIPSMFML